MLKKPDTCKGCPMYQDGMGFVPDEIIPGAEVFVLGQNPGEDEESEGKPFVGKTGQMMTNTYFPAGGLIRGENVSIGNVLRCRWERSNNLPSGKTLEGAIRHCTQVHLTIPPSTRLIVAQGALALKAVAPSNKLSITDLRGFLVPGGFNANQSGYDSQGFESQEPQGKQIHQVKPRNKKPRKSSQRKKE